MIQPCHYSRKPLVRFNVATFMVRELYLNEKSSTSHPLFILSKIREEILSSQINCIVVSGNGLAGKLSDTHITTGSSHVSDSGHTWCRNSEARAFDLSGNGI